MRDDASASSSGSSAWRRSDSSDVFLQGLLISIKVYSEGSFTHCSSTRRGKSGASLYEWTELIS
jgi:hypothetical protein